ncbi:ATP-dependent DNA ligase [Clostridium sp.]|jgi:DNA ligase-1|uniref:ATP-dependent DNA ligase n=1 Tax=Clostridium sp. TaxID=1506 RepID=UPI003EEB3585
MYQLFKKDSKGKIRFLDIDTDGATIVQVSGIIGGKHVTNVSMCKAKNIGKSNETSAEDQAELEANAKFVKKLKEGYFKTEQDAMDNVVILPMLAKVFGKEEKKIVYPCYAQPKLDGMRGLGDCNYATLTSRSGNVIETLDHITTKFPAIDVILDGELYAHGKSFQENMRMIKKYRPGTTEAVNYHVYDLVSDKPFVERYRMLKEICLFNPKLILVPTIVINDKEDLMKFHSFNISEGYEGTIVRWGDEGYKLNGRSSNLLKLKDFSDIALPLMDVIPSDARPDHGKPLFYWKGAKNDTLGAGIALTHEEAKDLLDNKDLHIGKTCELRFFEKSDTGVPRHPTMYGFRLDK